ITAAISAGVGFLFQLRKPTNRVFYLKEGFIVTALAWLLISILGSLPFLLSGSIVNPVDALFETVSGFTTTGASILSDVEALPRGMLFWRSFTHWIGGMGVLVFLLTILPMAGGSYTNLMKAESPGPQVEKFVPKIRYNALILYGIYLALTVIQIVILAAAKMPIFDALTITFGTAGTGGFGVLNDSVASYTPFQQNVITVFMILFGINFNFYFLLLLRKLRKAFSFEEVRWYLLIIAASILVITIDVASQFDTLAEAFRHTAFQVGSIITTTGFSTVNFDLWPSLSKSILVLLMFIGACAGSTGGGIKVSRIVLLFKTVKRELRQVLHPSSVRITSMDGKTISRDVLHTTNVYLVAYTIIFALSVLLITVDGYDLVTNFTAVAATLNNIGPGLSLVGPACNFGHFSAFSKLVMIFDMLAGRLELFPLLILFTKETWRKF
ncbi:MAG: TrkH family potassium uptake protein, partial [Oscillospiraceae bacterium]|nr:TrkH family potassium uptake protein [Oscillospiraceae bacterium]